MPYDRHRHEVAQRKQASSGSSIIRRMATANLHFGTCPLFFVLFLPSTGRLLLLTTNPTMIDLALANIPPTAARIGSTSKFGQRELSLP